MQKGFQCSAFSTAYVLRHFDKKVDGGTLYSVMPHKMKSGYVYPKGLYVAKLWNECKILSWQFEHLKGGFAKGKSGYRNDTGTKGQGLAALCSGSRI